MTDVKPPARDSESKPPTTTTDSGILAPSDEYSLTVGPAGPTVLHDHYVVQKMQHFNRERVPERVVHAKGSGAHGFFEVTEDVTQLGAGVAAGLGHGNGKTDGHASARAAEVVAGRANRA